MRILTSSLIRKSATLFASLIALLLMGCVQTPPDPLQSAPRSSNQPGFMPGTSSTGIELQVRFNSRADAQSRMRNINAAANVSNFDRERYNRLRKFVSPAIVVDGVVRNGQMSLAVPNFVEAAKSGPLAGTPAFIPVTPGEHRLEIWATDYYSGQRRKAYSGTHRFLEGTTISVGLVLRGGDERIEVEGVPYDLSTNPDLEERYRRLSGGVKAIKNPGQVCINADYNAISAKIKNLRMSEAASDLDNLESACTRALQSPASSSHVAYLLSYGGLTTTRNMLLNAQDASKGRRLTNLQSGLSVIRRYGRPYANNKDYKLVEQSLLEQIKDL